MIETIVSLKPPEQWREIIQKRWYSDRSWLNWSRPLLTRVWPEKRRINKDEILTELNQKVAIPECFPLGCNLFKHVFVMLQSGFRAMMGVKIFGNDLHEIERVGLQMEQIFKEGARASRCGLRPTGRQAIHRVRN